MIVLPPAPKGPGMVKSPPMDIANLTAILKLNARNSISLADFRKNIVQNPDFYQERGIDLSVFKDVKKCLRHFLTEDAQISRTVDQILSGTNFNGIDHAVFSVSVLEQFSLPLLLSAVCLAKQVKKESPDTKIIFFGNCPTEHIEKIMRIFKLIDAFPMGGNEFHVADYIHGKAEGVADKKIKSIDLNAFPLADYSLLDLESYASNGHLVLPYELSRGCSSRCFFCYYIYKGMINTKEPAKAVADFLMLSRKYGTDRFHLTDAAVNLDPEWLMRFCDLLAQQPEKVRWCALAIPNLSHVMMDKLKAAGCVQLRLGVETGSERMLKKINKGTTRETIKDTLAYAHSIGINNYITLISGLPGELESDIEETREFMREIAPYVDSIQECIYGELGHFPLAVLEPAKSKAKAPKQGIRYKDIFGRLNLRRIDIIDFMSGEKLR
jgi:hypothetical protein